jgi:hypothetical protein
VKVREGRATGVQRHACRAKELFRLVSDSLADSEDHVRFGGMDLRSLCEAAESIAENSASIGENAGDLLTAALPLSLSVVIESPERV